MEPVKNKNLPALAMKSVKSWNDISNIKYGFFTLISAEAPRK